MAFISRTRVLGGLSLIVTLFLLWRWVGVPSFAPSTNEVDFDGPGYRRVELEKQKIEMPFLDPASLRSPNWNIAGDVVVENHKHISLTNDKPHQAGLVFCKEPFDAESFQLDLTFHIHGNLKLNADGMALWITERPSPIGDVFGARGDYVGLGIFVDTFRNGATGQFPYVNAQIGTGSTFYNKYDDGMSTQLAGCTAKSLMSPSSEKTIMRLTYMTSGFLSVEFNYDPDSSDNWHKCFTVYNVKLPQIKYLGLSAETGQLSQSVDILESHIYALYDPDADTYLRSMDQARLYKEEQSSDQIGNPKSSRNKHVRGRKSVQRMRLSEERVKQRDRARRMEKYGDPDATFVRRTWAKFLKGLQIIAGLLLLTLIIWIVRLVMKTRSQNRRSRTTGLLD